MLQTSECQGSLVLPAWVSQAAHLHTEIQEIIKQFMFWGWSVKISSPACRQLVAEFAVGVISQEELWHG